MSLTIRGNENSNLRPKIKVIIQHCSLDRMIEERVRLWIEGISKRVTSKTEN